MNKEDLAFANILIEDAMQCLERTVVTAHHTHWDEADYADCPGCSLRHALEDFIATIPHKGSATPSPSMGA